MTVLRRVHLCYDPVMDEPNQLLDMEMLFMALADKTRLRLLNLMSEGEVCVHLFTEVLGDSQPKVSRHLAYLRNTELVKARRDGKWMFYSISWPEDQGKRNILRSTLSYLNDQPELQRDKLKYDALDRGLDIVGDAVRIPIREVSRKANIYEPEYTSDAPSHNELDEFLL